MHSRVPVVIPQRVCEDLLTWVRSSRAAVYFVLHVNHPQEIDASFAEAMRQLRMAGATLLNQTVLLRDINDTPKLRKRPVGELIREAIANDEGPLIRGCVNDIEQRLFDSTCRKLKRFLAANENNQQR